MEPNDKQHCSDCSQFGAQHIGNCAVPGYGTKASNNACDRFNDPPPLTFKEENKTTELNIYSVLASCSNCNFNSIVQVDTGTEVRGIKCPECKCLTLFSSPIHILTIGDPAIRISTFQA